MNTQQDDLIVGLVEDVKPEVERIENSIPTTQNHYGDYMTLINIVSQGKIGIASLIAIALFRAGANKQGVTDAYKILFPCTM